MKHALTQTPSAVTAEQTLFKPFRVVAWYTVIGCAWIFCSDWLTNLLFQHAPRLLLHFSMLKGTGFVLVTAGALYILLRRHRNTYVQQQKVLHESQEHYRLVVEGAPYAMVIYDAAFRLLYANAAALRLFGAEDARELLGTAMFDHVHASCRDAVRERLQHLRQGASVSLPPHVVLRLDGSVVDVEGAGVSCPLEAGPGVLVFWHDIGPQKAAERSLREREAQYRLLADNVQDVIFLLDADSRLTYISPSVKRLRGISVEQALQETLRDSMTPASYARVQAIIDRHGDVDLEAGYLEHLELEFYRQDGSTVWVESVVRPMHDEAGQFVGFVGVSRNISRRRQAEQEERRFRAFLSTILSNIPDPVFVKDAEHRFVLANEAFYRLTGQACEGVIGKQDRDFVLPAEAEAFWVRDAQVLETGEKNIAEETFVDPQGDEHILVTKKGLLVDSVGQRFLVGVSRDVTADKRTEVRLRDSLREKEVLLKEVHHRVKNNLQIISSLLFLQQESIDDPTVQELFEEARNRIASMALVHEELYRSADLGRVDLKHYLERLAPKVVQALAGQKQLELTMDLVSCPLPVDKIIPFGLLVNELLTNAVKHGFAERTGGSIRLTVEVEGRHVRATVEDDGVALPEGFRPEICKTLGMQLVVQLTRQLRGALTFGSGSGSLFRVSFPLDDTPAATS